MSPAEAVAVPATVHERALESLRPREGCLGVSDEVAGELAHPIRHTGGLRDQRRRRRLRAGDGGGALVTGDGLRHDDSHPVGVAHRQTDGCGGAVRAAVVPERVAQLRCPFRVATELDADELTDHRYPDVGQLVVEDAHLDGRGLTLVVGGDLGAHGLEVAAGLTAPGSTRHAEDHTVVGVERRQRDSGPGGHPAHLEQGGVFG